MSAMQVQTVGVKAVTLKAHSTPTIRPASLAVARFVDLVIAFVGLLVALPLLAVIAVAVKLSSPGPVLFRQERVGRGGRTFNVLKFRSMSDGTHDEVLTNPDLRAQYEANDFKLAGDDPRITTVGKFLHKTSLDELPQLFHVLSGKMSLVGIRPLLPQEVAMRSDYDQHLYGLLRPGLTGLWQVEGRSAVEHAARIELDRRFIEEWSLRDAAWILLRTPMAVVRGAGAH